MRCSLNLLVPVMMLAGSVAGLAQSRPYNMGTPASPEEISKLGLIVGPEGKELPPGSGTAKEGAEIFAKQCAACHGRNGEGGAAQQLVLGSPGNPHKGTFKDKERTPISYWAYATTLWDYINRAMPANRGGIAQTRRSLRGGRPSALSERHHPGNRRHGRQDLTEGPDAESQWLRSRSAGVAPRSQEAQLVLTVNRLRSADCLRNSQPSVGGAVDEIALHPIALDHCEPEIRRCQDFPTRPNQPNANIRELEPAQRTGLPVVSEQPSARSPILAILHQRHPYRVRCHMNRRHRPIRNLRRREHVELAIVQIEIAEPSYAGAALPVIEGLAKPDSSIFLLPWANGILDLSSRPYVSVFHTPGTRGGKLVIRSSRKWGSRNLHRRRWLVLFNVNDAACLYAFGPNRSPDSSHPWLRLCLAEDAESRFPVCLVLDRDQPLSVAADKNGAGGARENAVHRERLI